MTLRTAALIVAAALLAACGEDEVTEPPIELEWRGFLTAEPGWEGVWGEAGLFWVEKADEFDAWAHLIGDDPGVTRGWRVFRSSCAAGGEGLGSPGDYSPLQVGSNGQVYVSVTVPQAIEPQSTFHVKIFESTSESAAIIACANLTAQP